MGFLTVSSIIHEAVGSVANATGLGQCIPCQEMSRTRVRVPWPNRWRRRRRMLSGCVLDNKLVECLGPMSRTHFNQVQTTSGSCCHAYRIHFLYNAASCNHFPTVLYCSSIHAILIGGIASIRKLLRMFHFLNYIHNASNIGAHLAVCNNAKKSNYGNVLKCHSHFCQRNENTAFCNDCIF